MEAIVRRLGLLGRTRRTTLVHVFILCLIGAVVLWFGQLVLLKERPERLALFLSWRPWIVPAVSLIFLWLSVRRFNDQDRPGWIALVAAALGIVVVPTGFGIAVGAPVIPMPPIVGLLLAVGYLVALFLPGTIGPNRYGPDPRGWRSAEHYREQQEAPRRN